MKGKLWFSKRTAFCLFVIIVKNLREGFFFFQKREENCWKEVSTIAITVLPNRKADCKVIKWGYHKPEERGPLSISEKKGLLNIVLTFSLYVVDGAINRLPLSMSNEVILDKELFIKVSAFKHFLKQIIYVINPNHLTHSKLIPQCEIAGCIAEPTMTRRKNPLNLTTELSIPVP